MRIVGGSHRGRRLAAPPGRDIRPTADRTRESLFNILEHGAGPAISGACVLDAFAGTGAMGLEALSRGAAFATFIDTDTAPCRANIETLDETARADIVTADCTSPPPARTPSAVVFLDPPYGAALAAPALTALAAAGWIALGAVCVVEYSAGDTFEAPTGFRVADQRRYGAARVAILAYESVEPSG